MMRLRDILRPEHILLDFPAETRRQAVYEVASVLKSDSRVADWPRFYEAMRENDHTHQPQLTCGLTLPHARTDAVTEMVMAFGRPQKSFEADGKTIWFILVVGIPKTMDAEYLRLVGTLMRVLKEERLRNKLREVQFSREILALLGEGESDVD